MYLLGLLPVGRKKGGGSWRAESDCEGQGQISREKLLFSETKTGSRDHIQQTTYWNPRVSVYDCMDEIDNPQPKSSDSNSTMYWKECDQ